MSDPVDPLRAVIAEIVREEVAKALAAARPANDEYLTAIAAGELAQVAAGTIRRWIREGRLPEYKAGRVVRVKRADLEDLLRTGVRKASDLSPEALARQRFG